MRPRDTTGFANVSVIVAAYRAASTIGRALKSIAAQTVKPREVIVVDDGSDDGTAEAARACASNMNGIELRVFRTDDNRGAGAARNRAVAESRQPVLAILDADDEWLPKKLERSLEVMAEGGYMLVAHDYLTGDGQAVQHHHCERHFREAPDPFIGFYRRGYIASCSVVTRREAVVAAGGFDEELLNGQDVDLWLAMLSKPGARFRVFGDALMRYNPAPGGITSHRGRALRCGFLIAMRHFPNLKGRPGSAYMNLWFRVAALHMQAIRAHGTNEEISMVLLTLALLPVRLVTATLNCFFGRSFPRRRNLASDEASHG